jgi:hypothetical protein
MAKKPLNFVSHLGKIRHYSSFFYPFLCLLGLIMVFYPTLLSGFSKIQTDPGDTRLVHYFLEHSFQFVFNKKYIGTPWSPAFFYPFPNVLAFSENLWGSAPVYWLIRAFASPDIAFQLWMIMIAVLNFFSFAFVLRRLQVRHELVGLGAFLFAFGMPRLVQLGHQQLLPQFFTPLALLFLWEFIRHPTRQRLALSLLFIYLQVLSGIYLGWFLLISLLFAVGVLWFLDRFGPREEVGEVWVRVLDFCRAYWTSVLLMLAVWALGLALTLSPYMQIKSVIGERTYAETDQLLPRLTSWFLPSSHSLWGTVWYNSAVAKLPIFPGEHSLFLGFTVLGLLGLGLYAGINRKIPPQRFFLIKLCLGISAILFVVSLRIPNGFSLWQFVYDLAPGATAIRAVSRIWTVVYCYLLIAICLSVDTFFSSIPNRRAVPILSILLCLSLIEQVTFRMPAYEKVPYLKQEAEISELIKGCKVAYLQVLPEEYIADHITAMWSGLKANVPVVNGYSGKAPPNYYALNQSMSLPQVTNWLLQSQKKGKGVRKPKTLCLVSHLSETNGNFSLAGTKEPQFQVTKFQLPIPVSPGVEMEYLSSTLPKSLRSGDSFKLPVILKNTSNFIWSTWGRYPTHFSYLWFNSSERLSTEQIRTLLPSDVNPGESIGITATIQAPSLPGEYRLVLTMVQEKIFWFSDKMSNPLSIPLKVTASDSL